MNRYGFRFYGDIRASRVMEYLIELWADKEGKRGISAQTFNFYLQAVKQFCRWMVKDPRTTESPVVHLDGLNVKTDRRHDRRAFTVDELCRLLDATRKGPDRYGMPGPEQRLLYWLAVETGLRQNELRSLPRMSFDLDGDAATVTVAAAYSKRRREDVLPLRPALARALKEHLATKLPDALAFRLPRREYACRMFQANLTAAGITYRDNAGRVADFHALRHTFISNLAAGGVHPKTAQALARHSTITLTMDRYTHSYRGEESEALAVLPDLSRPAQQQVRATGTEDAQPVPNALGALLGASEATSMPCVDSDRLSAGVADKHPKCENPAENAGFPENERRGRDSNPWRRLTPLTGLANRRFRPLSHLSPIELWLGCRSLPTQSISGHTSTVKLWSAHPLPARQFCRSS